MKNERISFGLAWIVVVSFGLFFFCVPCHVFAQDAQKWQSQYEASGQAYKVHDFDKAEAYLTQSLDEAKKLNSPKLMLRSLDTLAKVESNLSNLAAAKKYYLEVENLLPSVENDPLLTAYIRDTLKDGSEYFRKHGDSETAQQFESISNQAAFAYYRKGQKLPWVYIAGAIIILLSCFRWALSALRGNPTRPQFKSLVRGFVCWVIACFPINMSVATASVLKVGEPYVLAALILLGVMIWKLKPWWMSVGIWPMAIGLAIFSHAQIFSWSGDTGGSFLVYFLAFWYLFYHKGSIQLLQNRPIKSSTEQDNVAPKGAKRISE
jgi:hypothetical protein